MKTKITYRELLAIEGLLYIAQDYMKKTEEIEQAIAEILEIELKDAEPYSWVTDYVYNDSKGRARGLIEELGIKLNKNSL